VPGYRFRILNVFAEQTFGGNPLAVFEDARGLGLEEMQAIALQFNLSETTFVLPSAQADARILIFTPGQQVRFAGHPTLGSACVVRALRGGGDRIRLEMAVGVVPVSAAGDRFTLTAPLEGPPRTRAAGADAQSIARLVGLQADDLSGEPLFVDAGVEHLLIPLRSAEAVGRARPNAALLEAWPACGFGPRTAYVFAFGERGNAFGERGNAFGERGPASGARDAGPATVSARFFFNRVGSVIGEDPGTGSACVNLGGWILATGGRTPCRYRVLQGEAVGRPCELSLEVGEDRGIRVGGRVIEIARGELTLPD
jgi:trans-2,3-dihydro-3-hydroxyanthranilate isomerase